MRAHLTYANVMATLAVFVALGGTSYAAATIGSRQIADGSVQGKDVKNGSLTGKDVKRRSLTAGAFAKGQLPTGARGATGPQGVAGPQGTQGPAGSTPTPLFASVNTAGQLNAGSRVVAVSKQGTGAYRVRFDRSLAGCALQATPGYGSTTTGANNAADAVHISSITPPNPAALDTAEVVLAAGASRFDASFYLTASC